MRKPVFSLILLLAVAQGQTQQEIPRSATPIYRGYSLLGGWVSGLGDTSGNRTIHGRFSTTVSFLLGVRKAPAKVGPDLIHRVAQGRPIRTYFTLGLVGSEEAFTGGQTVRLAYYGMLEVHKTLQAPLNGRLVGIAGLGVGYAHLWRSEEILQPEHHELSTRESGLILTMTAGVNLNIWRLTGSGRYNVVLGGPGEVIAFPSVHLGLQAKTHLGVVMFPVTAAAAAAVLWFGYYFLILDFPG